MLKNTLVLFLGLSTSFVYSGTAYDGQSGDNIVNQMSEDGVEVTSSNRKIGPNNTKVHYGNYEEVVYQHFLEFEGSDNPMEEFKDPKETKYSFDIEGKREKEKEDREKKKKVLLALNSKNAALATKEAISYGHGYCYLDKDIVVERIATYAYFKCDFQAPFNTVTLALSMVPEFYAKALIGNPLYVEKNGKRFPIANGVIMTKDRNSINLANLVNDNLTKKIVAAGAYKGIGIVAKQAQAYLEQKKLSDIDENTTINNTGLTSTTTSTKTVKEPNIGEYLAVAGIEFVSEMAKVIGQNYIKSLPYTFKTNKGNVFYADVQFSSDINMEGYKIQQDNIVKREPIFTDGVEADAVTERIPVLNNHGKESQSTSSSPQSTSTSNYSLPASANNKGVPKGLPSLN